MHGQKTQEKTKAFIFSNFVLLKREQFTVANNTVFSPSRVFSSISSYFYKQAQFCKTEVKKQMCMAEDQLQVEKNPNNMNYQADK